MAMPAALGVPGVVAAQLAVANGTGLIPADTQPIGAMKRAAVGFVARDQRRWHGKSPSNNSPAKRGPYRDRSDDVMDHAGPVGFYL